MSIAPGKTSQQPQSMSSAPAVTVVASTYEPSQPSSASRP